MARHLLERVQLLSALPIRGADLLIVIGGSVYGRNPSATAHSFASRNNVFSNTLAPFSICSQSVNSAGEWLRP